jgi:hypothetical protein
LAQINPVHQSCRQRLGKDFPSTDDRNLLGTIRHGQAPGDGERLRQRMDHQGALCLVIGFPGDDDVVAVGQRLDAEAFPGAPPHDHRSPEGELAKQLEIGGELPWQAAGAADHAIARRRHHEGRAHG